MSGIVTGRPAFVAVSRGSGSAAARVALRWLTELRRPIIDKGLEKRAAIVTGGRRGPGRGIAHELARAGAAVAVVSRALSQLEAVGEEIATACGRALAVVADDTDRGTVEACAHKTEGELGPVCGFAPV